jgi:hypothetical protein
MAGRRLSAVSADGRRRSPADRAEFANRPSRSHNELIVRPFCFQEIQDFARFFTCRLSFSFQPST